MKMVFKSFIGLLINFLRIKFVLTQSIPVFSISITEIPFYLWINAKWKNIFAVLFLITFIISYLAVAAWVKYKEIELYGLTNSLW
jgi:TRAP-type mannitol/chloroaromatic compound transport system permease small subunit